MKINISRLTFQERKVLQKILKKSDLEIGLGEVTLDSTQYREFVDAKTKLAEDYPLDYILGEIQFLDKNFDVDENVLIPREETEYWVENLKSSRFSGDLLVDVGTGSGVIGISLSEFFQQVYLVDVSAEAIQVADKNIQKNKIKNSRAVVSDLFDNPELKDVINSTSRWTLVANLPYLPDSEKKYKYDNNVSYEPEIALYSGSDGLDLFRKMMYQLSQLNLPDEIYLELDPGNVEKAAKILSDIDYNVSIRIDVYGKNRFLVGQR